MKRYVVSFCEGDNHCIIPLYKEWSKDLYFLAYKYLRSHEDAEDVVSEVFEKLLSMPSRQRRAKFIEQGIDLHALLLIAVRNKALDRIKVRDNRRRILNAVQNYLPTVIQNGVINKYSNEFVDSVLRLLPQRERQIFKMSLKGYKREEIASEFKLSQKTVSNSLSTSRSRLKELLEDFN